MEIKGISDTPVNLTSQLLPDDSNDVLVYFTLSASKPPAGWPTVKKDRVVQACIGYYAHQLKKWYIRDSECKKLNEQLYEVFAWSKIPEISISVETW